MSAGETDVKLSALTSYASAAAGTAHELAGTANQLASRVLADASFGRTATSTAIAAALQECTNAHAQRARQASQAVSVLGESAAAAAKTYATTDDQTASGYNALMSGYGGAAGSAGH